MRQSASVGQARGAMTEGALKHSFIRLKWFELQKAKVLLRDIEFTYRKGLVRGSVEWDRLEWSELVTGQGEQQIELQVSIVWHHTPHRK